MRKITNFMLAVLLLLLSQNSFGTRALRLGLYTGYTHNHLFTSTGYRSFTEYKNGHGYVVGVPVNYSVFDYLAVQTDPSVIMKSYSLVRTGIYGENYQTWNNTYLQLPVSVQFSFGGEKLRGFVNLGGYFGGWLNSYTYGRTEESTSSINGGHYYYDFKENVKFNSKRDNRFDGGLFAGLGLKYDFGALGIFAEARYYYSLSDMQKNYMLEQIPRYNDTYVFTFGIMVKINK
jgi:hypothetical protein